MLPADAHATEAGFTLIEVIVSFVILVTVLGSVTLSLSYSARLGREAEAKRLAVECAERVIAEKFFRLPDLPKAETGGDEDCRWRIIRKLAKANYTESGRNLMAFKLEILHDSGRPADLFKSYYVEDIR